jgi:hypothetical protein
VGLEVAFHILEPRLTAASHRARFKAALLREPAPHELITLGSSRMEMDFSPAAFARASRASGKRWTAFNAAISDTSLEYLDYLCREVAQVGRPRLALVELSEPQLKMSPLDWERPTPTRGFEARMKAVRDRHLALARLPTAFRVENLGRLFLMAFWADALDGSEHSGSGYLKAVFGVGGSPAALVKPEDWPVEVRRPRETTAGALEAEARSLARCAEHLRAGGATVAFLVPPTRFAPDAYERRPAFRDFIARVASLSGASVLDFSVAPTPWEAYRDWTHLSAEGRVAFTVALERVLEEHGLTAPPERAHAVQ